MENNHGGLGNFEISQLVGVLESLEKDLRTPYSKSRPTTNPIETQLKHALSAIKHREGDLVACIGISKVIIQTNSSLNTKLLESLEANQTLSDKLQQHLSELSKSKDENHQLEDKVFEHKHLIEKLEDEINHLKQDHNKLLREHIKKTTHERIGSISFERFFAEISDVKNQFRTDYDSLMSKINVEEKIEIEAKFNELSERVLLQESIFYSKQRNSIRQSSTDLESCLSNTPSRPSLRTVVDKSEIESNEFELELKSSQDLGTNYSNSFLALAKNLEVVQQCSILIKPCPGFIQDFTEEIFFNMVRSN